MNERRFSCRSCGVRVIGPRHDSPAGPVCAACVAEAIDMLFDRRLGEAVREMDREAA